jgi:hypothetical protein
MLTRSHDIDPGAWCAHNLGVDFYGVHAVLAVRDADGDLVGCAVLHSRTKYDCELSYFGPRTMTLGMFKAIAISALNSGMIRVTVALSSKDKPMARHMTRIGLQYEGRLKDHRGPGHDTVLYAVRAPLLLKFARRS